MTQIMLGDTLRHAAGPLADFFQKLSGVDGMTKWLPAFKRFLRQENPWDGKRLYAPWLTITIGQRRNVSDLIQALHESEIRLGGNAQAIIESKPLYCEPCGVDLIKVTPRMLGFTDKDEVWVSSIRRRAKELGLMLCTPEMAAEARIAHQQTEKEWVCFLMKPFETDHGPEALDLTHDEHDGTLILCSTSCEDQPSLDVEFICELPR